MIDKFDFIEVYDNVFSKEYCEELIKILDFGIERGLSYNRQDHDKASKLLKEDTAVYINQVNFDHVPPNIYDEFNSCFWGNIYQQYINKYNIVKDIGSHSIYSMKIQKTEPSQGYHVWHCENGAKSTSHRVLAYSVYLNDNYEAGETEFLYQQRRIVPKQGSVCLFPAYFTHAHRGNPPINGTKYILTGWVEF